jgi:hypothetical protein
MEIEKRYATEARKRRSMNMATDKISKAMSVFDTVTWSKISFYMGLLQGRQTECN